MAHIWARETSHCEYNMLWNFNMAVPRQHFWNFHRPLKHRDSWWGLYYLSLVHNPILNVKNTLWTLDVVGLFWFTINTTHKLPCPLTYLRYELHRRPKPIIETKYDQWSYVRLQFERHSMTGRRSLREFKHCIHISVCICVYTCAHCTYREDRDEAMASHSSSGPKIIKYQTNTDVQIHM